MLSSWRTALSTLVLSAHGHHGGSKRSAAIGSILLVMAMFVACGDDDSDSATRPSGGSSSSVCEDCDDESSSSGKEIATNSSSSRNDKSSSSSVKSSSSTKSSSSAKSSSSITQQSSSSRSRPTDILEPEITVNETCEDVGACDAMVKTDVSTWHFVRKDAFGDDAEYTYTADGRDLIVTIKNADGSTDSKTYSMYNMESEAGVEMAFNAAKSTCMDGGGNDNVTKACVKDTTFALPECDESLEGVVGKAGASSYVTCKSGSWVKATDLEVDLKSACVKDLQGEKRLTSDSVLYKCNSQKWEEVYIPETGSLVDDRDGQTYKTVKIGDQWWMAENMNYEMDGSFCYHDSAEYCEKYGRLYLWSAAMDSVGTWSANGKGCGDGKTCLQRNPVRGVCPDGWHLPTYEEWESLITAVGGRENGKALKSTSGWNDNGDGTDDFGFSALPAGYVFGGFTREGYSACFWGSSELDSDYADRMVFSSSFDYANLGSDLKFSALSVRCLKD